MGIFAINDLYMQGKIAAIVNWNAVSASSLDPKSSKVSDKTAVAAAPGTMQNGELVRWDVMGGHGTRHGWVIGRRLGVAIGDHLPVSYPRFYCHLYAAKPFVARRYLRHCQELRYQNHE